MKKYYFLLLFFTSFIQAQFFPVSTFVTVKQPVPIYLKDFADASTVNSPLQVRVQVNDVTLISQQVRLKFFVSGSGVNFQSRDFISGAQPIYLEGGGSLVLTNRELAPYFEFPNLQGISGNEYARELNEGFYSVCVEVYDFFTNKRISAAASTKRNCAQFVIFQNEPPFLNLPEDKSVFVQQNIQNFFFSWTPRQINVSNVEYEFQLLEIWDKSTNPLSAFEFQAPLFTQRVRTPSFRYGMEHPQLVAGKRYAWRVRAIALQGFEEVGVFKNGGKSQVFWFDYDIDCKPPTGLVVTDVSQDGAKLRWDVDLSHLEYDVKYREKNANSKWYSQLRDSGDAKILNLRAGSTYEVQVGASCQEGKYVYTDLVEFTTIPENENANVSCGIPPAAVDLSNKNPLPVLKRNDVVYAGDYPVVVLNATGSNGVFSGDGYVTFGFLEKFRNVIDAASLANPKAAATATKFSRIRITFSNIGVNTDYKLIAGEINASYDKSSSGIVDGDKLIDPIIDEVLVTLKNALKKLDELLEKNKDGIKNQEEFEKEWVHQKAIENAQIALLYNSDELPQFVKDDIKKNVKDTRTASTDKTLPKIEDFKQAQESNAQTTRITNEIEQTKIAFDELLANLGVETILKCKKCTEKAKAKEIKFDKTSASSFTVNPYNKNRYKCILGALNNGKFEFKKIEARNSSIKIDKTLSSSIKQSFEGNQDSFLKVVYPNNILIDCKIIYLHEQICDSKNTITDQTKKEIGEEVDKCYNSDKVNIFLPTLVSNARSNQDIEFFYNNEVYHIEKGIVEKMKSPLTDEQINSGEWNEEGKEVKMRLFMNADGILQIKSFGIQKSLPLFVNKTAVIADINKHIKDKTNVFFVLHKVTNPGVTPKQTGFKLNNGGETFADGKKFILDENSPFFSYFTEGAGLVITLLKTTEIEEKTYVDVPKEKAIIKAPGVVTGSVEVVAQKVTDLTSLATGVYDLATDEKVRTEAYNGLAKLKESLDNDSSKFIPIFTEVVIEASTGNSKEQWKSLTESETDNGKKTHLITRGTGNAIVTAMAGVTFVKKLPEMAEKIGERIKKIKNIDIEDFSKFLTKTLNEKLKNIQDIWKTKYPVQEMLEGRSFFEDAMGQYRYLKSSGWSHTGDISPNFKGVDFYKGSSVGNQIFAETAVSMKTTITSNVDNWLASAPIKKNIEFLEQGLNQVNGLSSNGKFMKITNAEIHIYMPKTNITESLKTTWMNKLNTVNPKIKFEIKALEDFIQ